MEYLEIREQICDVCHKMWQLGWVAASFVLEIGMFSRLEICLYAVFMLY